LRAAAQDTVSVVVIMPSASVPVAVAVAYRAPIPIESGHAARKHHRIGTQYHTHNQTGPSLKHPGHHTLPPTQRPPAAAIPRVHLESCLECPTRVQR